MILDCFAALRFSFSPCFLSLVCYLYYTKRNVKTLRSQNFKNPLLISIYNDKQKYF